MEKVTNSVAGMVSDKGSSLSFRNRAEQRFITIYINLLTT
jgi:hypothetical protein